MDQKNMTIRDAHPQDKDTWNKHAAHPLQSWEWGEFRKAMGIDVVRRVEAIDGSLTDCWQLTFHQIPRAPWTIGYLPKGPLPTKSMLEDLKKIGISKKAIFIQLEPNILAADKLKLITANCLIPSHHPLFAKYTFVLDLTKSEDELLKSMHSKTRYNIKIASRYGVTVTEDNSDSAWQSYMYLSQETAQRQKFYAHDLSYHQTLWQTLKNSGMLKLFTASYQKEVLSAWLLFCWNDTVYYPYGASSRNRREVMAPTAMLWEIAKWAKKKKFKYFDLWGALGQNPDTKDPWYGFHRFKEGFSPKLVEYIGSYDLILNPLLYQVYKFADTLRWGYLNLKRR